MKECPMCGDTMRLCIRDVPGRLPGAGDASARIVREWSCPECDYFEEADSDEGQEGSAGAERQQ